MKKRLALFLSLVLVISLLTTFSAYAEETKPSGKIVWLSNSAYGDIPQALANAYMEYNPSAEIELESYTRTELMKVIDIKVGAGDTSYDVMFVDQPLIASYYWKDYLLPLNEYFTDEELSIFTDADLGAGYVEGDLEALPLASSSQVLLVNLDLLSEAGLALDESVLNLESRLTFEQLHDMAVQFQQKMDPDHTKGYWGFAFSQQTNPYQLLALGNSLGEKAIADDGITIEGVFNTDNWVKAFQFLQDLHIKDQVSPVGFADAEGKELFYSGKMLFYLANTTRAAKADFNITGILHPYFEGGEVAVPTGSWYLGINKYSKNAELAADLLKFCTAGEGAELWMLLANQVPARIDLLSNIMDDQYEEFREWPGTTTKIAAMENLAGNGYMRPTAYGFGSFDTYFANFITDIRSGANVRDSLDATTKALQADFDQYR